VRTLLQKLAERVASVEVLSSEARVEREEKYERIVGYDTLTVRLSAR
jgi:hypothetical protein